MGISLLHELRVGNVGKSVELANHTPWDTGLNLWILQGLDALVRVPMGVALLAHIFIFKKSKTVKIYLEIKYTPKT